MSKTASLTAKEFAQKLTDGDLRSLNGRVVEGSVNLMGVTLEVPLALRNTVFNGAVNFSQARFKRSVNLRGCRFATKLVLSDARIEGPLSFENVTIGSTQSIDANSLDLESTRVEGSIVMTSIRVHGDVSLQHAEIQSGLILNGVKIDGTLWLRNAKLGELRNYLSSGFQRCRIGGNLDLDSAKITGDVFLEGIKVAGDLRLQAGEVAGNFIFRSEGTRALTTIGGRAWLLAAHIKGNLDLRGTRLQGDLTLALAAVSANFDGAECRIRGSIRAEGARIENDVFLSRARVAGSISFDGAAIKGNFDGSGTRIGQTVQFQSIFVGGSILLRTAVGDGENAQCRIGKKVWLVGAVVTGDIDISGALIGDDLMMQGTRVGQNLLASNYAGFRSEIKGLSFLVGARVDGNVEFLGSKLHKELDVSNATIAGKMHVTFDIDEGNNWQLLRPEVYGRIHARSVTVGKSVSLLGLNVSAKNPKRDTQSFPVVVNFQGARINGQFALYDSGDYAREMLVSKQAEFEGKAISDQHSERIINRTLREFTILDGSVHLTAAQVLGGVVLDGASIHGELDLRDATIKSSLRCKEIMLDGRSDGRRGSALKVNLEALDMTGDIDLTGLDITGSWDSTATPADEEIVAGDLILRDAKIRGRLELCSVPDSLANKPAAGAHHVSEPLANIDGALRLDAAEISYIALSGHSFKDPADAAAAKPRRLAAVWEWLQPLMSGGVDEGDRRIRFGLERGRIGRLQIVEPLPGTIDLSNLRVDRWSLPDDEVSYERMLRNSFPFKRSNYLAIENTLRNEGLDERADAVHVAMRRRDRRSTKSRWQIWFDSFLDLTVKYGTTSKRVAFLMVFLFALTLMVFSNPNRVEYKIAPASQKPPPVEHPAPANWGLAESALFAVRLNVPVVSLGIEDKMQPSGFQYKLFAIGVVAANWVMWPLLLASMSGLIRRKT